MLNFSNYPETGVCSKCGCSSTMCVCEFETDQDTFDEHYNEDFTDNETLPESNPDERSLQ